MTAKAISQRGLFLRSLVSVLTLIALWEATGRAGLAPALFLPPFTEVISEWWSACADGSLPLDLVLSLSRAAAGLCLATLIGVPVGIAMARSRLLHWLFDPVIALAFPSPKIAFLPIFILWFGIYSLSKILLVAFACVFPILIGSFAAASSVNRVLIWSAASMGTSHAGVLFRIVLPAAWPRIFASLRVALPVALITTFTAEMVSGGGGMGATLMYSQRFFESPTVFAYVLTMLGVGLLLDFVMLRLQAASAWSQSA
ncbi:MAG TPA: ABC transporter permease [Bradyrhizobium sp.]|uniref:ABC transporter permease n=1 Tax=Bradyrhizobium sp. TaxID=376 RepID=UPI002D7F6DA0|nr:ABC transporter permease [Bradyrhizobium sp.]HET7886955.1 ABC transporter permease [Bradyrhizobium sp.]